VLEIGAGTGQLTADLARAARAVVAVEIDAALVAELRRRFAGTNVVVVHGDALERPAVAEPFRVFANVPFHRSAETLHHLLDDPAGPLTRADLILQWGAVRKRAAVWPATLLGVCWGAFYTFTLVRRLPAACFSPRPLVDAGLLAIERRGQPLVPVVEALRFRRFVQAGFAVPRLREGVNAWLTPRELRRLADIYGFPRNAAPRELDVHQWTALFRASGEAA